MQLIELCFQMTVMVDGSIMDDFDNDHLRYCGKTEGHSNHYLDLSRKDVARFIEWTKWSKMIIISIMFMWSVFSDKSDLNLFLCKSQWSVKQWSTRFFVCSKIGDRCVRCAPSTPNVNCFLFHISSVIHVDKLTSPIFVSVAFL